jgi:hypothetical protein
MELLLYLLSLFITPVYADNTNTKYPSGYVASIADFTDMGNLYTDDQSFSVGTYPSQHNIAVSGFNFNLPSGAVVQSVTIGIDAHYTGSASIHNILTGITRGNTASAFGNISGSCDYSLVINQTYDNTQEITIPLSCYPAHTFTNADFGNDFAILGTISTNNNITYYIDSIYARLNYTGSTGWGFNIDSATASPSSGIVYLNLSGTTATVSPTMICTVGIFEHCTSDKKVAFTSQVPVAHIKLDSSYQYDPFSFNLGAGYYTAFGWGRTDSSWQADHIEVPYNAGYKCDYPVSYSCYEGSNMIDETDYSHNQSLISTPSGNITNADFLEPPPDNPILFAIWSIKKWFWDTFGFVQDVNELNKFEILKNAISVKAPFAYFLMATELEWTDTNTATAPAIVLPIMGMTEPFTWQAPNFFYTAMDLIKTGVSLMIYVLFIVYLFNVPRRYFGGND